MSVEQLQIPERTAERLIGLPAIEMVEEIVRRNSLIGDLWYGVAKHFSLTKVAISGKPVYFSTSSILNEGAIRNHIEDERRGIPVSDFSLASRVIANEGGYRTYYYIPMIDFEGWCGGWRIMDFWERRVEFRNLLRAEVGKLGEEEGVYIFSGGGIHYWGSRLRTFLEWREFCEKLNSFNPIDVRMMANSPHRIAYFRPDKDWLRVLGAPDKMRLRFTNDKWYRFDPIVMGVQ